VILRLTVPHASVQVGEGTCNLRVRMFTIRKATPADRPAIEHVMRESLRGLGKPAYDDAQIASSLAWIAHADAQLIDDGTYFVAVAGGEVVACGGWSKRGKLYAGSVASEGEGRLLDPETEPARIRAMFTLPEWARKGIGRAILEACEAEVRAAGFQRIELMAMLSGERLYVACGYAPVETTRIVLQDGTELGTTVMTKSV
jgi:GNAT superfamily N-acetyltransferase